jgi:hypothetical protein
MRSLNLSAGQVVQWTVSGGLGTAAAGGAANLYIAACYAGSDNVAHEAHGGQYIGGLTVAAGQRHVVSTGAAFTIPTTGTYQIGLCAYDSSSSGNWNSNDWFNLTAFILPAGTGSSTQVQEGARVN